MYFVFNQFISKLRIQSGEFDGDYKWFPYLLISSEKMKFTLDNDMKIENWTVRKKKMLKEKRVSGCFDNT